MFGTGARFAEYGITGGFFILLQLLVIEWMFPGGAGDALQFVAGLVTNVAGKGLEPLYPAIQSLLVALALLSVFIAGLLLDLIGALLVIWEERVFRTHLLNNSSWIGLFIETELPEYKNDYDNFLTWLDQIVPRTSSLWRRPESYAFWRLSMLRQSLRPLRFVRATQRAFRRLEAAFIAKLVVAGVKTDFLSEQMSICRMSRAITSTIYFTSLGVIFATLYREERLFSVSLLSGTLTGNVLAGVPAVIITVLANAFAIMI